MPSEPQDLDRVWLLGAFDGMDTPAIRTVLNNLSGSVSLDLQAVGLAGLIARSAPGATKALTRLWTGLNGSPYAPAVISAVRDSWRDSSPGSISDVVSFAIKLSAGDPMRAAAVRALAAIHTKETLPFLASLLASADSGEQERAIYGISAFANGCPMQTAGGVVTMNYLQCAPSAAYRTPDTASHFAFRPGTVEQESALAAYWQSWWERHGKLH